MLDSAGHRSCRLVPTRHPPTLTAPIMAATAATAPIMAATAATAPVATCATNIASCAATASAATRLTPSAAVSAHGGVQLDHNGAVRWAAGPPRDWSMLRHRLCAATNARTSTGSASAAPGTCSHHSALRSHPDKAIGQATGH